MRKGRRARIAGRLLGGILSAAVVLGSYVGTGLTAYADEETGKNAGYHSEWVNGSWYEADGTRSDSYKGKWMKNKKGKWYQDISGWYPKKRWQTIDGKVYYFDADGYLECDAYRDGYYLGKDGSRDGKGKVPGWKETAGEWYFNLSDGTKLKNTWKKINGRWYFFDKNGAMSADSWKKSGGKWYYLGKNGAMVTGWKKLKDIWYFLGKDGKMQTGWKEIDGTWYYFDQKGRMYSNAYIDKKYFVDENGAWDGVTIRSVPKAEPMDTIPAGTNGTTEFTFYQEGWYVARLEVEVWDEAKQEYLWLYSDSRAKGQSTTMKIDTEKYDITRVGYQIWFFGWDNDYMNLPWENTSCATTFTLSGSGDYPEFDWK